MTLDVGKLGRAYLIALLLVMTILCLSAFVMVTARLALKSFGGIDPDALWRSVVVWLAVILVLGADLWGVIRRQRWSYYLSLIIYASLIAMAAFSAATREASNPNLAVRVPGWVDVITIVLYALALGWLALPGARAQFSSMMHTQ